MMNRKYNSTPNQQFHQSFLCFYIDSNKIQGWLKQRYFVKIIKQFIYNSYRQTKQSKISGSCIYLAKYIRYDIKQVIIDNLLQMNFPFNISPFQNNQEAALYFNSYLYNCSYTGEPHFMQPAMIAPTIQIPLFYQNAGMHEIKANHQAERPTDCRDQVQQNQINIVQRIQCKELVKDVENERQKQQKPEEDIGVSIQPPFVEKKEQKLKNLKKNTESNVVHNVFSFICSELKSHSSVRELIVSNPEKLKIFYIFTNNLKKVNGTYLSKKSIKNICEICPKGPHARMLAKSIKRLQILPISELRVMLRKLIFHYLRGSASLLPLLTSNKMSKNSMLELLNKRRMLAQFMNLIVDFNEA